MDPDEKAYHELPPLYQCCFHIQLLSCLVLTELEIRSGFDVS